MSLRNVLVRPILTEKSTGDDILGQNTYVFEVRLSSTKQDVKTAIEGFYDVDVDTVRTLVVRGKKKRFGRFTGKRSNWKKAYVTLSAGSSIDVFGEE